MLYEAAYIVWTSVLGSDSGVLPFLALDATYSVDTVVLPESDEGTFGPIELPVYGFPFWSSNRETAYVSYQTI